MWSNGLEGVVAAETRLSEVDGEQGRLILAGHDVEAIAGRWTFEQAAALFLGVEPGPFSIELGLAREAAFERLMRAGDEEAMDSLRASVARLPSRSTAASVIGAIATFAAAWARRRSFGQDALRPDPQRSHAADYLRMIRGAPPNPAETRALDTYWVATIDHGMNASTFAARVVASTGSDLVSAAVAAIGALKGPLHGGAPGPVLDMLDGIGSVERAEAWLGRALDSNQRIMGMGHRIYRVRDPRAAVLERALLDLGSTPRLDLARHVESTAERLLRERHPDRPLKANVEFYTAVLLEALGVPRALFTASFAAARSAGWCAHVAEQKATGRLIRPQSRYVGPRPEHLVEP